MAQTHPVFPSVHQHKPQPAITQLPNFTPSSSGRERLTRPGAPRALASRAPSRTPRRRQPGRPSAAPCAQSITLRLPPRPSAGKAAFSVWGGPQPASHSWEARPASLAAAVHRCFAVLVPWDTSDSWRPDSTRFSGTVLIRVDNMTV